MIRNIKIFIIALSVIFIRDIFAYPDPPEIVQLGQHVYFTPNYTAGYIVNVNTGTHYQCSLKVVENTVSGSVFGDPGSGFTLIPDPVQAFASKLQPTLTLNLTGQFNNAQQGLLILENRSYGKADLVCDKV